MSTQPAMSDARDVLDAQARAQCAVCADLLAASSVWFCVGPLVLAGLAAAILMAGASGDGVAGAILCWWAALLVWLAERYVALRIRLDARLFDRLSRGEASGGLGSLALLDGALQKVLGVPAHRSGRSLDERLSGTRRWWRRQLWLIAGQVIWALGVVIWIQFKR
jgi:hypothetical protein